MQGFITTPRPIIGLCVKRCLNLRNSSTVVLGEMNSDIHCPKCQMVSEAMTNWSCGLFSDTFEISLGTYAEFEERVNYCKTCHFVVHHFRTDPSCHPFRPSCCLTFSRILSKERFWIGPAVLCGRGINDKESCEEPHGYLELIPSVALMPNREHFIEVDPHWVEIQRVRLWPAYCDENHHGSCHGLSKSLRVDPTPFMTLIDVESCNLIQVSRPVKYVALSYVWGELENILEATKDNFSQLQQAGSLNLVSLASRLPLIVRDAMCFTKLMGERYLWVDRLCIVQDDTQYKAMQLSFMSSIYANSYFTIVAADGKDANAGLGGVCKGNSPRSCYQSILHFSRTCSMMPAPRFETQFNRKEWHKRGWTYQERTLSNRNLVFFQGKVFWECPKAIWIEDLADVPDGISPSKCSQRKPDQYSFEFLQWPDLHQYAKHVGSYNNRLITYQSDALQAFSAIITALGRPFQGGFCHGMPELYFDYGLLWRPNTPTRRRPDFPSWSWVGWQGNVVFSCLKLAHQLLFDKDRPVSPIHVYPMCKFHKIDKQTGKKHIIRNAYYSFQRVASDPLLPLPAGWSRTRPSNLTSLATNFPDDVWVYKHESMPSTEFIHPIPISPHQSNPESDTWDNQLIFRTARCFLFSGGLLGTAHERKAWDNTSNTMVPYCVSFLLVDTSGQYAGMMYSNFTDPKELVLGQKCEIIIISGSIAHLKIDQSLKIWLEEWKYIGDIKGRDTYEFYNVLWIERKGGIAYRKALGRVWKEAWQRQLAEEIDVILG